MQDKTISRRSFMTASASITGLAALGAGLPLGAKLLSDNDAKAQRRFMTEILDRSTAQAKRSKPEYIDLFVSRFEEVYGVVDYKEMFSGPFGEYRLSKLYIKSVFRPA